MNDPFLNALAQEEVRNGATYYSPAHLVNYQRHWIGTPQWEQPGGMYPYQMFIGTFFAPPQPYGTQYQATGVIGQPIYGSGQAPTTGIYTGLNTTTGVEGCDG